MPKKKALSRIFLIAVLAVLFIFPSAVASSLLEELAFRQKAIKTVKASFTQEKHTKVLKSPIKSKGAFYFKSPASVRWEYEKALTVIYDGETLYLYYPELNEAEKIKASGFTGFLSFNIADLTKDYAISSAVEDGEIRIRMKPKKQMPFSSIEMTLRRGEAFPSEVRMEEKTGETTVIKFSSVVLNAPLSETLFTFSPTQGVKIRERKIPR